MSNTPYSLPFLSASAIGSDVQELVNLCLRDIGEPDPRYTLGFIYVSDALFSQLPRLQSLLHAATGIEHWCGTLATAVCSNDQEYYDQPALSLLLCPFDTTDYCFIHSDPDKNKLLTPPGEFNAVAGIIHADPTNPQTPLLLQKSSDLRDELMLAGGLTHSQTKQLQILDDTQVMGLSGVLFNEAVNTLCDYTQGCSPIGEIHTISDSHNNFIKQLNGRPALDVLRDDIGEVLARDMTRLGGYVYAGLLRQDEKNSDYVIRDLLAIDENSQALVISDIINTGDEIVFCRRDGNSASNDLDEMLARVKHRLNGRQPRGALYHSCIERGRSLFGDDSQELKRIQAELGDVPLSGFFASGEIYQNQFYTHTGVLTLFL